LGTTREMWRKSSGFRVSPLTLRGAPFRVSRVGKPKSSGAPGEPPGTGPRPTAGSEPGVTGRPEADRHGGPGTDRGAHGHVGTGTRRRLSDTTCDGWSPTTSTWPRGAGAASAARLLGAASRSPSGSAVPLGSRHRWRWVPLTGADSMAHGSTSTSTQGSHSSSRVLWAIPNGTATASLTRSRTTVASSSVG